MALVLPHGHSAVPTTAVWPMQVLQDHAAKLGEFCAGPNKISSPDVFTQSLNAPD